MRFSYNGFGPYLDWQIQFSELFDFAHVPSRFAGTRWGDPALDDRLVYREPGKINLHTATDAALKALQLDENLVAGAPRMEALLDKLIDNNANNPYTILYPAMRLSDVTTAQSNVFAVWITVGYFASDASGHSVGNEKGLDDGTVRRYRAFYLIDRSIPVGFRQGEELNAREAILMRTLLE